MSIRMGGGRAVAIAIALIFGVSARAESADRSATVIAARIDLQRQLGEWLTRSLTGPAEPFRVEVSVRADLRGRVREIREKLETASPGIKIGGKNKVKLPGLGMVDGGGQAGLLPEINIDGGGRTIEQVSRHLETEVVKMTVMLLVDPVMPKERRELLVKLAGELAGIDRARGDEVVVQERPGTPGAVGGSGTPITVAATLQAPPKLAYEIIAICSTALLAAAILAFGLSRRAGASIMGGLGGRASGAAGEEHAAAGAAAGAEAAQAEARKKRREELGAFQVLADATPKEIAQVVAEADAATATGIVDLFGLDAETSQLIEATVPPQRRLEIGVTLATARTLTREQLAQMEAAAAAALQRVRNRVPLGGPARLAEFLAQAPASVRREVLEGVAARDERLAQAARSAMVLFEDLPRLADASVRQVITGIDPSTIALALVGAPEVRDVIHGAISKRLRGILEVEEEVVQQKPPEEIEAARRVIEDAMRQLNDRGELRQREAAAA